MLKHAQDTWAERSKADSRIVAPYSKANPKIIDFMLPKLGLTKDSVFYDMGCGDGRWLVAAAKRYGCRCVGLELQAQAADDARRAAAEGGVSDLITVLEEDFYTHGGYGEATAVALYLSKEGAKSLAALLRKVLAPGVVVVCLGFHLPGWIARGTFREDVGFPVFLYDT